MSEKLLASTIELRDRLRAFVGAVAEITDCGPDVDAIVRADEAIAAWNLRTPAPEGDVVATVGMHCHLLWTDAGVRANLPTGTPLYASPVVPVGVSEAVLKAAQSIHNAAIIYEDEALLEDAEIVLAALRPTDTGANHD
jgi:hypothetical protein